MTGQPISAVPAWLLGPVVACQLALLAYLLLPGLYRATVALWAEWRARRTGKRHGVDNTRRAKRVE